jgi:hypothetical protein
MTRRAYLQEDMQLIRHYFPGAKTVALRTPFELTVEPAKDPWELLADDCDEAPEPRAQGDLLWNR